MARSKSLPTIWEVPDDLWERIEWLLNDYDPPKTTGRSRTDARKRLDGIIFRCLRLATGRSRPGPFTKVSGQRA